MENIQTTAFNYLNSSQSPSWILAQYDSPYNLGVSSQSYFTNYGNGIFGYKTLSQNFGVDTNQGMLTLGGTTSNVYSSPRTSTDPWFALLTSTGIENPTSNPNAKVSNLSGIQVSLSARLTKFIDKMNGQANSGCTLPRFLFIFLFRI